MSEEIKHEIVIIKRVGHGDEDGHHGGVWKIAFADFMTAMMAFFLVLWIVNSSSKETRSAIARYFNPMRLSETTPARKGLRDAKETDSNAANSDPGKGAEPEVSASATNEENAELADCGKPDGKPSAEAHAGADPHSSSGSNGKPTKKSKPAGCTDAPKGGGTVARLPRYGEEALFRDPYAILTEIAKAPDDATQTKVPAAEKLADQSRTPGLNADESFRDPFEPVSPVLSSSQNPALPAGLVVERQPQKPEAVSIAPLEATATGKPERMYFKPSPWAKEPNVPGAETPVANPPAETQNRQLQDLQDQISRELKDEIKSQSGPSVEIKMTGEGTLISLMDGFQFGMFAIGSAEPDKRTLRIMEKMATILKSQPGRIVLRGHTDARPYSAGNYDNWRLSTDRAQMAHYMLVRGGLDPQRLDHVEGYAERQLKLPQNPKAAENRRIEILIRREKS